MGDDVDVLRSKGALNVLNLASAMAAILKQKNVVAVAAMGVPSITTALVGITWTRRFLAREGLDARFYSEFKSVAQEDDKELCVIQFVVQLIKSETPSPEKDEDWALTAIRPLGFIVGLEELKSFQEAFATFSPKSLPNMKIGASSSGNSAASVLVSQLRFFPGMHMLSCGESAGNNAFKTLCIARTYVREVRGYDLGLQCIHAPKDNIDGNCQLSIWNLLVKSQNFEGRAEFKVGQKTSAQDTGTACGYKLRAGGGLSLVAIGVPCVSKMFVVLSFARSFLEQHGLDVVGFPSFDSAQVTNPDGTPREMVRFRMNLVSFEKQRYQR